MTRINQPVAMITGGNRGIGRGITERLLREGWAVAIMATRPADEALLTELGALGPVRYTQGSVADLADDKRFLTQTVEAWGRVDALVNNAGVAPSERLDILVATPESYDQVARRPRPGHRQGRRHHRQRHLDLIRHRVHQPR